ncbi:hypothetical protein DEA8626_00222 [Defluviimonas aquaemixtae]|uniref:Uncharacterized protein n=1 Tax=Albidovulum aquaemixtae TaxID=1542388 RepID=A0A2R8B263_9RHOB|nr:hypothetical protein [Defluviimonas aquaemixtae]SPH16711.1 hypothetical protein DEA8626_00222 [Defluviimonas aquaemixtae]
MSGITLRASGIRSGHWEGEIEAQGDVPPSVEIWHMEQRLDGAEIAPSGEPGRWRARVPIPPEALNDGVQTFLVSDGASNARIGQFTIIAGVPLEEDIRAEIGLLRAELDILKKAFRRHCAEKPGQ